MRSEFKLLKVINGRCHFAQVCVEVDLAVAEIKIEERLPSSVDGAKGKINRSSHADWVDAAIRGINKALMISVQQKYFAHAQVSLFYVMGVEVDTTEEDVQCAASLATWQAVKPDSALPPYRFIDGKWLIDFD